MDPNLIYWKDEGKTFFSRLRIWFTLLDPSSLLASDPEIQNARSIIRTGDKNDEKTRNAWILSLSSVHADSGGILPFLFRPPVLFPASAPLVVASFVPHTKIRIALFWQVLMQSYSAGFNFFNRNSSTEQGKASIKQALLVFGAASYAAVAGAAPQIITQRIGIIQPPFQTFFRSIVPIPLSAALAAFNVIIVRFEETENGVQVFDSNGNTVGISKAAGWKAVRDTALARATLLGTVAIGPHLLASLLQRTRMFQRNSLLLGPVRFMASAVLLGLMIPVSFSLFPQLGTIKKENLEKDLQDVAVDGKLFYHRGL